MTAAAAAAAAAVLAAIYSNAVAGVWTFNTDNMVLKLNAAAQYRKGCVLEYLSGPKGQLACKQLLDYAAARAAGGQAWQAGKQARRLLAPAGSPHADL